MSELEVVSVAAGSVGEQAGFRVGDTIIALNGQVPRDVIEYQTAIDEPELTIEVKRGGLDLVIEVDKPAGVPLGLEVDSPLFDQVRTCDNHCSFCFIYQLPAGLRPSLYVKDDDYRLSFLYGNFTTLTRFTESDLERVVSEGLSPINVSIHATNPEVRAEMLRNRRGATSLRWLRALLDAGVAVHGQVVVCPGVNDGDVLEETLCGIADEYPQLASVCVVPLGVSRHSDEPGLRPHLTAEATAVVDAVEGWQARFVSVLGRRLVFAADEYYLLGDRPMPAAATHQGFPMYEDGVGMARHFIEEFRGRTSSDAGGPAGFFAWVDGAVGTGYRAPRAALSIRSSRREQPVAVITGTLGAQVLRPLLAGPELGHVRVVAVENRFFGGNIGVTGLLAGPDVARALAQNPPGHRYLLPDVCLSGGRFIDGSAPDDLPRPVEIIAADGHALRRALAA